MGSSNVCWGIEIGAGSVKAVKLDGSSETVTVADFAIVPHSKVLSTPDIDQNDAIRVALGTLANRVDLSGASVAVSVAGHSAFARFAKLPPVEPKKVPDIVKFEAVQQIPFALEEVEWDYQTFVSPDSPDIEVGIFAMRREQIKQQMSLYQDVGIVPDVVTLSPVAAYNALAHDLQFTESTEGTIILDVGTTSTDLIVADAGRVWVRTFPIGGHHFTEALVEKFSLSYPKAEKLKREAAASKHAKHVYQAMQPVYGDLAQDVQRSIGYYQSLHPDTKLTRLIGLGSTFSLPGMRRFLKQQLGLNVYKLEGFKRIDVEGVDDREFQSAAGNLATAYGLALQGLNRAALKANLMPVEVIKAAMWRRKVGWFGVAASIAVATSGVMFLRPLWDSMQVNDIPDAMLADIRNVASQAQRLKSEAGAVTQSAPASYLAPNLQSLTQWRDIYPLIVDDVAQMVNTANTFREPREGEIGPAFMIESLRIDYQGKGGEKLKGEHDAFQVGPVDIFALIGNEFDNPDELAAEAAGLVSQKRLITVNLELTTTRDDARTQITQTIDRWLRDNRERPGTPYRFIGVDGTSWAQTMIAAAGGGEGGGNVSGGNVSGGEGGFSGEVEGEFNVNVLGVGETGAPATMDSGPSLILPELDSDLSMAAAELHNIAPLPRLDPVHDKTKDLLTFTVNWMIEVYDGNESEEGGL